MTMETLSQAIRCLRKQHYYQYRQKDLFALFIVLLCWYFFHLLSQQFSLLPRFFTSFFLMAFMTAFATFLVRKFLIVLFMLFIALLLMGSLPDLTALGNNVYLILFFSGVFFEILYLFLFMETHVVPFDVIFTLSFSFAALPLFTFLVLSPGTFIAHIVPVLNFMLIDFFLTLFATGLAFLLWFHLRTKKLFVAFEYKN